MSALFTLALALGLVGVFNEEPRVRLSCLVSAFLLFGWVALG